MRRYPSTWDIGGVVKLQDYELLIGESMKRQDRKGKVYDRLCKRGLEQMVPLGLIPKEAIYALFYGVIPTTSGGSFDEGGSSVCRV